MWETVFTSTFPSAQIPIHVRACGVPARALLSYEDKENVARLCAEGCPDYNRTWSCPPHSPSYSLYEKSFDHAVIVLFYTALDQFDHIENLDQRIRTANTVLRSILERSLRSLEKKYQGRMLSSGICRLCLQCSCIDKSSGCKRPKEMRYSMESLGLHVIKICADFLNHKLDWCAQGIAPNYVSSVACLLTKKPVDEAELIYVL
ncbi:DUF2284 domain-containing protein [Candidatus Formimonas warabiya]|uniref:DUF2284 domain-containing protein n=1 Tax=Formimonas warabiya TaxID=1761012 RepID=A0A3G1KXB5_FORW1|nr:DUF2284 domain-containing protein [Candidatus Formimonas warabiya]ATW27009.1 hypothetical protein DCMF_21580 [Candidatus Formimonas warabiya]